MKFKNDEEKIFENFIYRTGKIAKQWGLGESSGRVWATLLFAEKPLTQKEISELTGYSLSLVSPSLKILEGLNMVRKTTRNKKEKVYELTTSFTDTFHIMIKRFLENEIKPLIDILENYAKENKTNKKLIQLTKDYQRVEKILKMIEKMKKLKKLSFI